MSAFWLYTYFAHHPALFALAVFITSAVVGHK
jgi:hypothetical protein